MQKIRVSSWLSLPRRSVLLTIQPGGAAADDAVRAIGNGMRAFIHGACASPQPLLEAMVARQDLNNVTLYHLHVGGDAPFARPEHAPRRQGDSNGQQVEAARRSSDRRQQVSAGDERNRDERRDVSSCKHERVLL